METSNRNSKVTSFEAELRGFLAENKLNVTEMLHWLKMNERFQKRPCPNLDNWQSLPRNASEKEFNEKVRKLLRINGLSLEKIVTWLRTGFVLHVNQVPVLAAFLENACDVRYVSYTGERGSKQEVTMNQSQYKPTLFVFHNRSTQTVTLEFRTSDLKAVK